MVWAALGKAAMGGLKAGAKKVATDKLLNRKKKTNKRRASVEKIMGSEDKQKEGVREPKGGALAVRPSMDLVPTARDLSPVSTSVGESDIVIIKKQVIQVRDILKDTYSAKQGERVSQRKARQKVKREEREEKIEKPAAKPKESKKGTGLPKPGLGIGKFLTSLVMGVIFGKLNDLLPALKKIFSVLRPITKFILGVLEKTVGFVVGFIDLAYTGVEKLRELIVGIGGEGAGKLFDKFGKLFTQVINAALIAALIGSRVGLFKKPKGPKGPKPKWRKRFNRWFKKTGPGKFFRNQKARVLKLVRRISKGPLGRTLKLLRPKNISNWINKGGVDKALKGGVRNVMNFAKNVKPIKTIQNLTKNIKPIKTLQNLNPFKGMNLGKKGSNLLKGAKNLGSKVLGGVDKWAKNQMGKLGSMLKGAKAWGAKQAAKLGNIVELAKNPAKLRKLMKSKLTKSIDDIVGKNKTLKNLLSMAKNPKKISGAIKGMLDTAKKSKGILNVRSALSKAKAAKVGGVDKIIAAVMALIDYAVLKESPINAIVKAVSGMLGYAAGFAIGAPFGGMPGFITGMIGGALGELAGYGLLKGLSNAPITKGLTQVVDPIMGAGPDGDGRPILRDPDSPMDHMLNQPKKSKEDGGKAMSDARSEMDDKIQTLKNRKKYGGTGRPIEYNGKVYKPGDEGYAEIIKSVTAAVSGSPSAGLDTEPSYGTGGMVRVDTITYIQPIEV